MYCSLPNPKIGTLSQPLGLYSYSEKSDEVGQIGAGMTYIHIQLPRNITAIYHQNEIIEAHLNRIMNTDFLGFFERDDWHFYRNFW